ncbi:MAG: phosphonate C-P lyase system protein PhnH [Clostridia bacterium]
MKLDLVHDIQVSFRKLLNSMSYPGKINSLPNSVKTEFDLITFDSTYALMYMLLDAEVTFHICSNESKEVSKFIRQVTNSKEDTIDKADYIFVLNDCTSEEVDEAIELAKVGTLINPHKSATIILEVKNLSNEKLYRLNGPGIKNFYYFGYANVSNLINIRNKKNEEYPMGIDLIFLDDKSNIMSIPRTTRIEKVN